jgi:hypothetical protein
LADEDSVNALAPTGYDDYAARMRVKDLGHRLTGALAAYEVRPGSTELYQDSTGLAEYRITAKGDSRPVAPTLAWILLSHFGDLATVKGCPDPELIAKIRSVLEDFGLKYIPYDYAASKIYDGRCKALVGFSWANRYFSLVVNFNTEKRP